jgi:hypothetical protein
MSDDDLTDAIDARRQEMLDGADGFVGECQEAVPFGEMFYVSSGGKEYMSCTHTPPHTHPVA